MLHQESFRCSQFAVVPAFVYCGFHKDKKVKFFCQNCKILVCKECVVDQHNGHCFASITDIASETRNKLQKAVDNVKTTTIPRIRKLLEKLKQTQKDHSENGTTIKNAINRQADERVTEINIARNELLQELETRQSTEKQILEKFEHNIMVSLSRAEELVDTYPSKIWTAGDANLVNLGLKLDKEVPEMEKDIEYFPEVKHCVFTPGDTATISIRRSLGCIVKDESGNVKQKATTQIVIENKLEVVAVFRLKEKNKIKTIAVDGNMTAWIATEGDIEINHVDQTGRVDNTVKFPSISDIAVTNDKSVLITSYNASGRNPEYEYRIMKANPNGNSVTFVDMEPLRPISLCISETGFIYVGCVDGYGFDMTNNTIRAVMKLSSTGIEQASYQLDSNGERLFTLPQKLQVNSNGDIWVGDRTSNAQGRIVVIQSDGKLKFIYTGIVNSKITKQFYPCDMTSSGNGSMLICDFYNHIIHVVDQNGNLLHFVGSQLETGIYAPHSVCMDRKHNQVWVGNIKGQVQVLRLD